MFYSAHKTENVSPGRSLSDSSEGLLQRGRGGTRIHRSFCNKDQVVGTSRLLLIKQDPISQGKEVSAFLCKGRCKSLGSLKSFL